MSNTIYKKLSTVCAITMMAGMVTACGAASNENVSENSASENAAKSEAVSAACTYDPSLANQTSDEEVPVPEGYNLLWHDEFNGSELDPSNWKVEIRKAGWTNQELQEYVNNGTTVFVNDGMLKIKALKLGENEYKSGKVNGNNLREFTYGKVVVRAKVPEGQGLWPAIWMMPERENFYGQWPKCGEIDIMEILGHEPDTSYSTIHYGNPHAQQQGIYKLDEGTFASDFHDYSVEWEPGEMRFYIDDNIVLTVNDWYTGEPGGNTAEYPAPFEQPFHVQLNLAVGGTWPGNPDETTDFENAEFYIDYVRVYQKPEYDTNVIKPKPVMREPNEDGNYINNSDFSLEEDFGDDKDWSFMLFNDGKATASLEDGVAVINTENEGTDDYSVQLVHAGIPFKEGAKYKVTFDGKAEEDRTMNVCISAPNQGYARYLPDTKVELTTKWQTYEYEFEMTEADNADARIEFNMGATGSSSTIMLDNVCVMEITE